MTTEELTEKRAEFMAEIEELEKLLSDPVTSRSISFGGGSQSMSTSPSDIRKNIAYFRRQVQLIDAALGRCAAPGEPRSIEVRFDA